MKTNRGYMQVSVIGPAIVDVLAGGVTKQIFHNI